MLGDETDTDGEFTIDVLLFCVNDGVHGAPSSDPRPCAMTGAEAKNGEMQVVTVGLMALQTVSYHNCAVLTRLIYVHTVIRNASPCVCVYLHTMLHRVSDCDSYMSVPTFSLRPDTVVLSHSLVCALSCVFQVSSIRVYLSKDLRPVENRKSVGKSIKEVQKRYPDGLPLLDPIEDMQIEEGKFKRLVGRVEEQQQKMVAHPMHADERRDVKYGQYATKVDLGEKLKHVDKEIRDAQVRLFKWFI